MSTDKPPDIRIVRGLFTSIIIPVSELGRRWVRANMYRIGIETSIVVNTEFLEELIKELERNNLDVQ